jgi:hypothetical protein
LKGLAKDVDLNDLSKVRAREPSDREGAGHFAARFSLRFFLFSALSFLVNGFFLALRIPNSIVS